MYTLLSIKNTHTQYQTTGESKAQRPNLNQICSLFLTQWGFKWTYSKIPVDLGYSCVKAETEQKQESPGDHQSTAADELKEIQALAGGTFHDGLYADERGQRQELGRKTSGEKK